MNDFLTIAEKLGVAGVVLAYLMIIVTPELRAIRSRLERLNSLIAAATGQIPANQHNREKP